MAFLIIFIKYILKTNDYLTVVWKWNGHCSARIRVALVSAWNVTYVSSPGHPERFGRGIFISSFDACPVPLLLLKMFCFTWETNYKVCRMSPSHWDVFPVDISPSTREPSQNRHSFNSHPVHQRWTDTPWPQLSTKPYFLRNLESPGTSLPLALLVNWCQLVYGLLL